MALNYTPTNYSPIPQNTQNYSPTNYQSPAQIRALQTSLNQRFQGQQGYTSLNVDGILGPLTRAAMNFQPALPGGTAPSNTANITQTGNVNIPQVSPYVSGISDANASTAGIQTGITAQEDLLDLADNRETANNNVNASKNSIFDFLSSQKSQAQVRQDAFQQIGFDPREYFIDQKAKIAEIGKLTEDYNAVEKARDEQLAATSDRLATNSFINNQQAQINRNAAPKLNAISANVKSKAAVLEALQGNFAEANKFVDQAVDDATADQKFRLDSLTTFYEMNMDTLDRMDKLYKDAMEATIKKEQDTLDYQRDLYKIKYTQEMQAAYSKGSGGSRGGISNNIESDFRQDGVSLLDQVTAGGLTLEAAYQKLRRLYSPDEVSDDFIREFLGYSDEAVTDSSTTTTSTRTGLQDVPRLGNPTGGGIFSGLNRQRNRSRNRGISNVPDINFNDTENSIFDFLFK